MFAMWEELFFHFQFGKLFQDKYLACKGALRRALTTCTLTSTELFLPDQRF
jgi:hypothetical protein